MCVFVRGGLAARGVLDGKLIIPEYSVTSITHSDRNHEGSVTPGSYLSNSALYELARNGEETSSSGF